jgi:hypothetical protein
VTRLLAVAIALLAPNAARADRACTRADVARFERMFGGRGSYHADPRLGLTVHYLGTFVSKGTCNVRVRPAD